MVSVIINGDSSPVKSDGLAKVADLIELIKTMIDPDHMITGILLNGRDLEEGDWTSNLGQHTTAIVEIETGTPSSFVSDRLSTASEIVRTAYYQFRDARKIFQEGQMQDGNRKLLNAVHLLQAFFAWYGSMIELVPTAERQQYDITEQVKEISEVCKRICQQQLYQSWWALGEALEKELEPKLDRLEDFCRKFRVQN